MTGRAAAEVLRPDGWPRPHGYADGMSAAGRVVVTAGQIGWNPRTATFETDDFVAQVRQALANVVAVLHAGGAGPEHLVRLTWFITDRAAYLASLDEVGQAYADVIGRHYPAMSVLIVAGLIESRAKVEIEATAVVPARDS